MNESEVNNLVIVLWALCGPSLAHFGLSSGMVNDAATGALAIGALGWAVYSHWNMKKVPESATVIGGTK